MTVSLMAPVASTALTSLLAEKALRSLPSPLIAVDEYNQARNGALDTIQIRAGLHRQVWVSGANIFVDVHIANFSRRTLKRLELSVERDVLCYNHVRLSNSTCYVRTDVRQAAASTLEKSASQARIFQEKEQNILSKSTLKVGTNGWTGVLPHSTIVRTCNIDIPRGHATIKCGMSLNLMCLHLLS